MRIGFIGLGRMGKNIVLNLLEHGTEVVAWNRSSEPGQELKEEASELKSGSDKLTVVETTDELVKSLETPRVIWLMVTAGEAVDAVLDNLVDKLEEGDLIVDGGNSFYKDTLRRAKKLSEEGIHFMDIGTSGGVEGARHGVCMMVGGSKEDFERVEEVLKAEAAPNAYGHFGPVGAGHFAKMIHNGIEYGMMESIGEGAALLKHGPFKLDLAEVFRVYQHRSVIESRLVGWTQEALSEDSDLKEISSEIKSTGEGEWTVKTAAELGIQTPVIEDSLKVRQASANDPEASPEGFRNKVVSAMRGKFGQHEVKKQE